MSDHREPCRYCRKPMANYADCDAFQPGEGEHLCWHILQNCDQDQEAAIDLRDAEIARLERELAAERALADRLAGSLENIAFGTVIKRTARGCAQSQLWTTVQMSNHANEALAAWKEARSE